MSNQVRGRLQVRRAGLATAVVLGCGLVAVAQVPAVAQAFGAVQSSDASAKPLDAPDFLSLRFATTSQTSAAAQAAQAAQAGSASGVTISGKPGTTTTPKVPGLPGITPTSPSTPVPAGSANLPSILAQAYQQAAAGAPAACHIPATLLEAIGQVESSNLAGQSITADHRAYPGVYGPELNGTNGFAAIPDTDKGVLDGDKVWDRAVGPMQFIPGTWRVFGTDGDHDGKADPQNVFDAAATAAKYLCYGGRDLSTPAGIAAAVLSYNHSDAYLQTVLAWKKSFDTGQKVSPLPTVPNLPNQAPTPTTPGTTPHTTPGTTPGTQPGTTTTAPSRPSKYKGTSTAVAAYTAIVDGGAVTFDASNSRPAGDGGLVSYVWTFGDGSTLTSTKPRVTHSYRASGTYAVKLTVTDSARTSGSVTHPVTVKVAAPVPAPVADFTVAATASADGTYKLILTASGATAAQKGATFAWTVDGASAGQGATDTYGTAVTGAAHTVTLVVRVGGVSTTKKLAISLPSSLEGMTIGGKPVSKLAVSVPQGTPVELDASKFLASRVDKPAVAWSFDDDAKAVDSDRTATTRHTFTKDGTATLTITDSKGNTEVFVIAVTVSAPSASPSPTTSTTSAVPTSGADASASSSVSASSRASGH